MPFNLVTEKLASEMTSIPRGTLRYWRSRDRGEGPEYVRVGSGRGRIKYDVAVLEDYVNQHRHSFSVRASNGGNHGSL